MSHNAVLERIREIIQRDVNHRGLATDPEVNLLTVCREDFAAACRSLAEPSTKSVTIITGFHIPSANAGETDGPIGAISLARTLAKLGRPVLIGAEAFCRPALESAIRQTGLAPKVTPATCVAEMYFPSPGIRLQTFTKTTSLTSFIGNCGHLVAIERAGPSHTPDSLQGQPRRGSVPLASFLGHVPSEHWDHCHTMRGQIITEQMHPAHLLFGPCCRDTARPVTIGIGDGGNEIGMGKIPWEVIARNVPNGGLVACRVATDHNIVCGVSNWGAYGLAAGAWLLRGMPYNPELFNPDAERALWEKVLQEEELVDGVTGQRTLTVDGLSWEEYIQPLREIDALLREACPPAKPEAEPK